MLRTEKSNKMHQYFIIPYLYEAQHVSGDSPPIIRSLKLHWQMHGSTNIKFTLYWLLYCCADCIIY